jgi:S1-C subfamily serine protease
MTHFRRSTWLSLVLLAVATFVAHAQEPYNRLLRGTAWVLAGDKGGAGCLIDVKQRLMLTNFHVVTDNKSVQVVFPLYAQSKLISERTFYLKNWDRFQRFGRVLAADPKLDLALVQLATLPPGVLAIPLAPEGPKVGDTLFRVGSPSAEGVSWTLSKGKLQAVRSQKLKYDGGQIVDAAMILSDMPAIRGHSGSATCNERGELVGVHIAEVNATKQSAGIHLDDVKFFLTQGKVASR